MEGKEIVEIPFSKLLSVIDYRVESEYFEKRFLKLENQFSKIEISSFSEIASVVNGRAYDSGCFNLSEGVAVSKIGDVTNKRDINSWEFVTNTEFKKQNGKYLQHSDILMTLTGDPPDVGKVNYIYQPIKATWNQRVARIAIKDKKAIISNEVLYAVLSSEYSRMQLERYAKGIRQRNLGRESLAWLQIPKLPTALQVQIEADVLQSFEKLNQAKISYQQAEQLLLNCLELDNFSVPQQAVSIKPYSESFGTSGRLDAEFYQAKYEAYQTKVKSYVNGFECVRTACKLKDSNFNPKDNEFYNYIELSDIGSSGEITGVTLDLGKDLPSRARRKIAKNDVIISSIEGSLSSCAIVLDNHDKALCSTGFYVISSDKINAETLLVLFKSEPLQQLLKQGCSGTILTAINKEEFLNIPLPLIDKTIQTKISQFVQQSSKLRTESKVLLEKAKLAVENAIMA